MPGEAARKSAQVSKSEGRKDLGVPKDEGRGQETSASSLARTKRLDTISLVTVVGMTLAVIVKYWNGVYLRLNFPLNTFMYDPTDRFNDLLGITLKDVQTFNTLYNGARVVYTPFQHLVVLAQMRFADSLHLGKFGILIPTYIMFAVVLVLYLRKCFTDPNTTPMANAARVFILATMSYGVLFALDRGNTEVFVVPAVMGFVYFYYIRPNRWLWIGFLALAIALKLFPVVLLLIPLTDRRYRDSLYAVLLTAAALLGGMWLLGIQSGFGFMGALTRYVAAFVGEHTQPASIQWTAISYGHSLWGAAYIIDVIVGKPIGVEALQKMYEVLAFVALAGAGVWMWVRRPEPWQKVAVVVLLYILLPFKSHDYTLAHVLIPLGLFAWAGTAHRFDKTLAALFGLLLVPLDFYYFMQTPNLWPKELVPFAYPGIPFTEPGHWAYLTSIACVIYPLVMLAILVLVVLQPSRDVPPPGAPELA